MLIFLLKSQVDSSITERDTDHASVIRICLYMREMLKIGDSNALYGNHKSINTRVQTCFDGNQNAISMNIWQHSHAMFINMGSIELRVSLE